MRPSRSEFLRLSSRCSSMMRAKVESLSWVIHTSGPGDASASILNHAHVAVDNSAPQRLLRGSDGTVGFGTNDTILARGLGAVERLVRGREEGSRRRQLRERGDA